MIELLRKLKKVGLVFILIGLLIAVFVKGNSIPKLFSASFFIGAGLVLWMISRVKHQSGERFNKKR